MVNKDEYIKFDRSSFSRSEDITGAHHKLNSSCDLITPVSGMICYPWARTCYDQPAYQICSLYLRSLQRYEKKYKSGIWVV